MKAAEYFNNGYTCAESVIMEAIENANQNDGAVLAELQKISKQFL